MLDIKYIRQQTDHVKQAVKAKNIRLDIDEILQLDQELILLNKNLQEKQRQKNENAKKFQSARSASEKNQISQTGGTIAKEIQQLRSDIATKKKQFDSLMLQVPNVPSKDSPIGPGDSANKVIKTVGATKTLKDLKGKNHVDLLLQNDWADFHRITQVCGSRSYCLKNNAVLLEQAIIQWGLRYLEKKGFQLISLPNFADKQSFIGSGHFPEGQDQVYYIEKDNVYLSGTAEVVLNSLYRGEILSYEKLPLMLAGLSPCFRREAGSAGQDVRGLLRVHQFIKLEQYIICENSLEQTQHWHQFLLKTAEEIVQKLELPYRVISVSTGDMGAGKYQMHDLECWLPSLNKYVETHSCSSLLDWQARRTGLRYRNEQNKIAYCHTLNNTAIALPRLLAMFLENHQKPDGAVHIPHALQSILPISVLCK